MTHSRSYNLMPIETLDDWELRLARQDAFWECELIDRPVVSMTLPKSSSNPHPPESKHFKGFRERWLDSEFQANWNLAQVANTEYLGDSLPMAWPNLGPDLFSAFLGCELEFGEETSWSTPILEDWKQASELNFSPDNLYWRKLLEMTDTFLEMGQGKFYTGLTDIHPGGDALAALRDPMRLNMDLMDQPEEVKRLLGDLNQIYARVYDHCYSLLQESGQAISAWPGIVSTRKWYVPSNDFSCMVSEQMFGEFFLPGIVEECRFLEASIYHLDGPRALRHLNALLEIPELNAVQWIYGAGNGRATDWMPVYHRCQEAGKGLQIAIESDELETIIEELRPNGVWLSIENIRDHEEAEWVLNRVLSWR
ncbi:MAG: trimethylamine corrinoid protein 2 [Candidatus Omnitrophica bacterium]|nr:trimethylamine corrinoid protein 2 [Candidatus Omnitrophota bacterium]